MKFFKKSSFSPCKAFWVSAPLWQNLRPTRYLESFLLAFFPFWKDFELHQWKQIFEQLEGDELAEYYMKVSSDRLLGIDPGFQSTKNLTIIAITAPDEQLHNASAFLPNSVGILRSNCEK